MALTLNYFVMIVGYISLSVIALVIILFTYLYLKEKYSNWKWDKERGKRQKEQEEKKPNVAEIQEETLKEESPAAVTAPENKKTD